jgi:hypothetical protein
MLPPHLCAPSLCICGRPEAECLLDFQAAGRAGGRQDFAIKRSRVKGSRSVYELPSRGNLTQREAQRRTTLISPAVSERQASTTLHPSPLCSQRKEKRIELHGRKFQEPARSGSVTPGSDIVRQFKKVSVRVLK